MISLNQLQKGTLARVELLPSDAEARQLLLTHGIHPGKRVRLLQCFPSQDLSLITCNGRKLALQWKKTSHPSSRSGLDSGRTNE